jgi:hypothetical protein
MLITKYLMYNLFITQIIQITIFTFFIKYKSIR